MAASVGQALGRFPPLALLFLRALRLRVRLLMESSGASFL